MNLYIIKLAYIDYTPLMIYINKNKLTQLKGGVSSDDTLTISSLCGSVSVPWCSSGRCLWDHTQQEQSQYRASSSMAVMNSGHVHFMEITDNFVFTYRRVYKDRSF
jgi:hypothetical protein